MPWARTAEATPDEAREDQFGLKPLAYFYRGWYNLTARIPDSLELSHRQTCRNQVVNEAQMRKVYDDWQSDQRRLKGDPGSPEVAGLRNRNRRGGA